MCLYLEGWEYERFSIEKSVAHRRDNAGFVTKLLRKHTSCLKGNTPINF